MNKTPELGRVIDGRAFILRAIMETMSNNGAGFRVVLMTAAGMYVGKPDLENEAQTTLQRMVEEVRAEYGRKYAGLPPQITGGDMVKINNALFIGYTNPQFVLTIDEVFILLDSITAVSSMTEAAVQKVMNGGAVETGVPFSRRFI